MEKLVVVLIFLCVSLAETHQHLNITTRTTTRRRKHRARKKLALCHDVTLDIVTHGWAVARHPRYTRVHHGGEAVEWLVLHGRRFQDLATDAVVWHRWQQQFGLPIHVPNDHHVSVDESDKTVKDEQTQFAVHVEDAAKVLMTIWTHGKEQLDERT